MPFITITFGVSKQKEELKIASDFRKLNEAIKRNIWPIPKIQDMLKQCGVIVYVTILDMIMSYYIINVRKDMKKYQVIILPWEHTFIREF